MRGRGKTYSKPYRGQTKLSEARVLWEKLDAKKKKHIRQIKKLTAELKDGETLLRRYIKDNPLDDLLTPRYPEIQRTISDWKAKLDLKRTALRQEKIMGNIVYEDIKKFQRKWKGFLDRDTIDSMKDILAYKPGPEEKHEYDPDHFYYLGEDADESIWKDFNPRGTRQERRRRREQEDDLTTCLPSFEAQHSTQHNIPGPFRGTLIPPQQQGPTRPLPPLPPQQGLGCGRMPPIYRHNGYRVRGHLKI